VYRLSISDFVARSRGIVISLCDLTGIFVAPWVEAGFSAILVDPQHTHTSVDGNVLKLATTIEQSFEQLGEVIRSGKVVFVAGFPPCTDVSVSGARWWKEKLAKDRYCQAKAAIVAEQCRTIGAISGAPYFFENPVSAFSNIFRSPDYIFHPWNFTGYVPQDNYTKKTCLWTGNGFVMPSSKVMIGLGEPDSRIHDAPPSEDRGNIRSATPLGFSRAVFDANHKRVTTMHEAAA
jgi:hypothetical protein